MRIGRWLPILVTTWLGLGGAMADQLAPGNFTFAWEQERCWLEANQAPVNAILRHVSETTGIPIVLAPANTSVVTVALGDCELEQLVETLSAGSAITYVQDGPNGRYRIERIITTSTTPPEIKEEQLRELVRARNRLDEKLAPISGPPLRYTGIGARIAPSDDGQGVWLSPLAAGTPAARAGIRPGDLLVAVDDRPVRELGGLSEISAAIRGPEHTPVRLRLRKPDGIEVNITVIREWFDSTATARP